MEVFPFMSLPALVREKIGRDIAQNIHPKDRLEFSVACKYFHWLITDAKLKQTISNADVVYHGGKSAVILNAKRVIFSSEEELAEILYGIEIKMFQLQSAFLIDHHIGFASPLKSAWLSALKFTKKVIFKDPVSSDNFAGFLGQLNYITDVFFDEILFQVGRSLELVRAVAHPQRLHMVGNVSPLILEVLAEKSSRAYPLTFINIFSYEGNTPEEVELFFRTAKFSDDACIKLNVITTEHEMKRIVWKSGWYAELKPCRFGWKNGFRITMTRRKLAKRQRKWGA